MQGSSLIVARPCETFRGSDVEPWSVSSNVHGTLGAHWGILRNAPAGGILENVPAGRILENVPAGGILENAPARGILVDVPICGENTGSQG